MTHAVYAGVGPAAGKKEWLLILVDSNLQIRDTLTLSPDGVIEQLISRESIAAAFCAPLKGAARVKAPRTKGLALRGPFRVGEKELRRRRLPVRAVPARQAAIAGWMQAGLSMARRLAREGFAEGAGAGDAPQWMIESPPAACFTALLGRVPFPRDTLEGRLQRQLVLADCRMPLTDPMDLLEELTAHHLLSGRLNLGELREGEELDALAAAFTAREASQHAEDVSWLGNEQDGWICLPAGDLKKNYSKPG